MNDLAVATVRSTLAPFAGLERTGDRQDILDALIQAALKIQDWPLVEEAISAKIAEQAAFVKYWDEAVSPGHGGDRSKNRVQRFCSVADAEMWTGVSQQQVSRWRTRLKNGEKYREQQILAAYRKAHLAPGENHRAECSHEFEWYTPARFIDLARTVMGDIDLDPATSPFAQQTVQADTFFTVEEDGLTQPWHGRVWLNPPYAQPAIMHFIEKLVEEYASGRVQQAILLTHNYTDTAWFHLAESAAALICFTKGRISFVNMDGESNQPTSGQAFFYFGSDGEAFRAVFRPVGFIR
jgi:phage N-6-adenine-methyltransferase